jgi:hypothetical protein
VPTSYDREPQPAGATAERLGRFPSADGSSEPRATAVADSQAISKEMYAAIIVTGLVFFWLNENFAMSGDSATYADYALNAKFDEITVHFGYYVVLWALDRTLGAWFGIPIHEMVAHMNVVFGALTLPIVAALGRHFLRDVRYALLATAIFAISGRTLLNATSGEIYMLQTLLVFSSFLLYVNDRIIAAAVVAGAAMYISPLSLFAYLFFPAYDQVRYRRVRGGHLARMLVVGFAVYLPFLVVYGKEMLFGLRGLLAIPQYLPSAPDVMFFNFLLYQFKHYSSLLLLGLPLLWAWKREKALIIVTLAVLVPHFAIILKLTGEDNVFIQNTDLFFACCLAAGARELVRLGRSAGAVAVAGLVAAHSVFMVKTDMFFPDDNRRLEAAELAMIGRTYLEGKQATLVTDWNQALTVPFFARPSLRGTLLEDPLRKQIVDATSAEIPQARFRVPDVYVLETWAPSGIARLLRTSAQLAVIKEENSHRRWTKEKSGLDCSELVHRGIYELYRCRQPRS